MRTRLFLVLALAAGAIMAPASAAHAQCAPEQTVEESLAAADTAFVGKVVDRSNLDRTAIFQVLEVWKGRRLSTHVTVKGGPENVNQRTSIDRSFLLGQIYLIIPANSRDPFTDSLCTGTRLWSTPTGTIPVHLQEAVGGDTPIPISSDGSGSAPPGVPVVETPSEGADPLVIAMGAVLLALIIVFVGRRTGGRGVGANSGLARHGGDHASPNKAFRKGKRLGRRFTMPQLFESRRSSRLDQVRKSAGRFGRGPGEEEKKQLERAVKLTATTPPKRHNHYTRGRRSAP